jgi:Fe-S cluster assembly protein SufD
MRPALHPTEAEATLARQFAARDADTARAAAFAEFAQRGLPNRRDEAWHYTDLRAALTKAAPLSAAPDAARLAAAKTALAALPRFGAIRLVLVDGRYVAELSDPAEDNGLTAVESADAPPPVDAVSALNAAFVDRTLRIGFLPGNNPGLLEILHLDGPGAIYSRIELTVPEMAKLAVFERFEGGTSETQRNAATFVDLDEQARCEWTTLVADAAALHLEAPTAKLGAQASFSNFGFVAGPQLARRQIDVAHERPGAKIALAGLSLLDGSRHADTTLTVRHAAPNGQSREFYRHIVADDATGVYQGKVVVAQHAQKTDGGMKSQALLLSPTAQMNNKPELEIFADDVVCGHGATVGALDPNQIFYLETRGIPKPQAEAMLLEAFGVEAIERIEDAGVAEALREKLAAWLKGRGR